MKLKKRAKNQCGFTLLEMLVALAVFLIVAGAVIGALMNSQKTQRRSEISVSLEQNMRAALELMAQEISQAGLQPSGVDSDGLALPLSSVVATSCTGSPAKCIAKGTLVQVPVTTVAGLYVNETVRVDADPGPDCYTVSLNCERLVITDIDATTNPPKVTFQTVSQDHYAETVGGVVYGTPIYGMGTYPQGILPAGTTASGGSTASQLEIFGDLNGAGNSFYLVKYNCPDNSGGAFTRAVYNIGNKAVTQVGQTTNLIDNVVNCQFTYPTTTTNVGVTACDGSNSEPVITSVAISVTAQSKMPDPATGQYIKITKSYLNIQPRNILAALSVASLDAGEIKTSANELQPNPNPSSNPNACQGLP
ncbi:MAG TPA: prepilin-type N-terminal cleavage/methylation domain-containing protein [Terriglobales bacterium]|nr:prepilin-type N-terminal cleavage/methylation domain-containing protein [Terriglobales bacterium]